MFIVLLWSHLTLLSSCSQFHRKDVSLFRFSLSSSSSSQSLAVEFLSRTGSSMDQWIFCFRILSLTFFTFHPLSFLRNSFFFFPVILIVVFFFFEFCCHTSFLLPVRCFVLLSWYNIASAGRDGYYCSLTSSVCIYVNTEHKHVGIYVISMFSHSTWLWHTLSWQLIVYRVFDVQPGLLVPYFSFS